ncbi:MAG: hypothetical protein IT514_03035 [Burkholderiales bacterium]|nr:hypothetical protein [Burkholderiales bacterium]
MKVLLDACIAPAARMGLGAAGHDVIRAADWNNDPGDEEILDAAWRASRILITPEDGARAGAGARPMRPRPAAQQSGRGRAAGGRCTHGRRQAGWWCRPYHCDAAAAGANPEPLPHEARRAEENE